MTLDFQYWCIFAVNTAILSLGVFYGYKKGRVYTILWGALLASHLSSILDTDRLMLLYRHSTLIYGQIYITLSSSILLLSILYFDRLLLGSRNVLANALAEKPSDSDLARYFAMVLGAICIIFAVRFRSGAEVALGGWEGARSELSVFDSVATFLAFVVFPSISIALLHKKAFISLLLIPILLGVFFIIGSRAMMLSAGGVFLVYLISKGLITWRTIVIGIIAVALILFLHTGARLVRGLGLAKAWELAISLELLDYVSVSYDKIDWSGGESKIYGMYYFVVERFEPKYLTTPAPTLVRLLFFPVPHSLFPAIKPPDITSDLWKQRASQGFVERDQLLKVLLNEEPAGSHHPTFWGDAQANLGTLGVFVYPVIFAPFFVLIDLVLGRLTPLMAYTLGGLIVPEYGMIARGSVVIAVSVIVVNAVAAGLLFYLFRIRVLRVNR